MKSSVVFKPFGIARRVLTCVVLAYHPETPFTDQGHLSDDGAPDDADHAAPGEIGAQHPSIDEQIGGVR